MYKSKYLNPKLYIGNLDERIKSNKIGRTFEKYGEIVTLIHKGRYAFLEYKDTHSADKAVDKLNGKKIFDH